MTFRRTRILVATAWTALATVGSPVSRAEALYRQFKEPPHSYFDRTPTDPFTRLIPALESGELQLPHDSERAFLTELLRRMQIPASSQLLVFSTTSLQLGRISPSNPRALYFNDDFYLGYVPGGRIELVALDQDLGAVFYIFDIPRNADPIKVERATRCMNCHAGDETGYVPGLLAKSVAAGQGGGSLDAFRREQTGHGILWAERFGGWHVTGADAFTNHWGNALGQFVEGELRKVPLPPGSRFSLNTYPVATSDILPHALHEHQVGFVNRVVEAAYRTRAALHETSGTLPPDRAAEIDTQADIVLRYLLFAEEVPLPPGGIDGDAAFKRDFAAGRRAADGVALRDLDLRTRLLKYRCSYMIYSPLIDGLPDPLKPRLVSKLQQALDPDRQSPHSAHLPAQERRTIRDILRATWKHWPASK